MDNKLLIHPITAPSLTEANYGDNLSQQFENIDANFHILGNQDFIKGQPGDGVKIENIKIISPYNMTSSADGDENIEELSIEASEGIGLYEALKKAVWDFANNSKSRSVQSGVSSSSTGDITPVSAEDPLSNIGDYAWDDNITKGDFYIPVIIYENKVNDTKEYICSAGVVSFFDNRFSASALDKNQFSEYSNNVVDVTSLLNFKKINGIWTCELNLSFPRLKYKDNTFYWVINDDDTLIKSTGIKGDRGEPGTMWIGKVTELPREYGRTKVQVEGFLKNNKWDDSVPDGMKVGDPIVVYCTTVGGIYNGFFITRIFSINNDVVDIEYDPDMNITYINYTKNTKEFLKLIGSQSIVEGTQPARGLFLLVDQYEVNEDGTVVEKESDISDYYAHMIYNNAYELNISPVQNYEFEGKYPELIDDPNLKLNIDYNTNIRNGLEVEAGGLTVYTGGASITGTTTIKGVTTINGATAINNGSLVVSTGGVGITGNTTITGATTIDAKDGNGAVWIKQNGNGSRICIGKPESSQPIKGIHIYGGARIHSDGLEISDGGLTVSSGGASISGNTSITGITSVNGNTSVTGTLSASNGLTVTGGGASITGTINLKNNNTTDPTGQIVINNSGKTTIKGSSVNVNGATTITGAGFVGDGVIKDSSSLEKGVLTITDSNGVNNLCLVGSDTGSPSYMNCGFMRFSSGYLNTDICNIHGAVQCNRTNVVTSYDSKLVIQGGNNSVDNGSVVTDNKFALQIVPGKKGTQANIDVPNGKVEASGGFFQTSDETLKDFHNDIQVDFEKLSLIPKKYFTWKDDKEKHMEIGTSAQEVQKLYPELVSENENGILSVSYDKLSIVALKAIDKLYKKNQELEERIEKLENLLK